MNKKIPTPIAAVILSVVASGIVWNAIRAAVKDSTSCPRRVDGAYCLQCHSDARILKKMKEKAGEE